MDTYARFTDRARKVMELANEQAVLLHQQEVGIEHVLLALIAEGSGVAANVLKYMGADFKSCRREVEKLALPNPNVGATGNLPLSSRAIQLIDTLPRECATMCHNYVGTEHLLIAVTRQREGVAAQVLANLGLELDDIRHEVFDLLGHDVDGKPIV